MNYKKTSTFSYNLHTIKTNKFKTITVKINFKRKLIKDEITARNMIVSLLCDSTKEFPTKRLMSIECENLYELGYVGMNYTSGIYNIMSFEATFLNEEYTEPGMLDKSIKFLSDLIFNPNVDSKGFKEENFKLAYNLLKENILSQKENSDLYSKIRLLEEMEPDTCVSYRKCGYIEDLEKLSPKTLYQYYESILNSDTIDIFVIGNISVSNIRKIIENNFKQIRTLKKPTQSHFYLPKKHRFIPKKVFESQKINQSKLVLGYKIDKMTDFELRYVLNVYSYILGGSADSKLFKTVREENSLCYYINSIPHPLNSIMLINAGINKKNYDKVVALIKTAVKDVKRGKFSNDDIIKAKVTYANSLKELEDSPDSILGLYAGIEYLKSDDLTERLNKINRVTAADVVRLASKVHLDTIYMLEGELDEEE